MGALSIRRLAAELGVDPMVIYHHLSGKEAGLSGIVEMVYGEMHPSANSGAAWQDLVRENAHPAKTHAGAFDPRLVPRLEPAGRGSGGPGGKRGALRSIGQGGLYAPGGPEGRRPRGGPRQRVRPGGGWGSPGGPGEREWFRALLEAQPADKFPALARVYDGVTEAASRSDFEYGLGVILAGLEASRIRGGEEESR
jgi:AcrR family transcriptional regulator